MRLGLTVTYETGTASSASRSSLVFPSTRRSCKPCASGIWKPEIAVDERLPVIGRAQHVERVRLAERVRQLVEPARHRRLLEKPRERIRVGLSAVEIQGRHAVFEEKGSAETRGNPESKRLRPAPRPRLDERGGSDAREDGEAQVGHHRPANGHPDRVKGRKQVEEQAVKRRRHAEGPHEAEPREKKTGGAGLGTLPETQNDSEGREGQQEETGKEAELAERPGSLPCRARASSSRSGVSQWIGRAE